MKKQYLIANWKMNLDRRGMERWFAHFDTESPALGRCTVVICPSFPFLEHARSLIGTRPIDVGAQNLFWEARGPYTGEVSGQQLVDSVCTYVIVGHSERRALFNETDEVVNQKIKIALKVGLKPIVCLGEKHAEKEAGQTKKVIEEKIRICFEGRRSYEMKKVIIAYEPIWAISTSPENPGAVADSPESAQVVHKYIRRVVAGLFDERVAADVPVIYGGSVTPENSAGFAAMDDIDGVLVGSASREADSFSKIITSFINNKNH